MTIKQPALAIMTCMFSQLSGLELFAVFASILLSMGIHEAMHAFTAHWLGDTTAKDMGRLTLNPLKHVDLYMTVLLPMSMILLGIPPFFIAKPIPFNPDRVKYDEFGAAMIGVAGPLTNLVLAILGGGIVRITGMAVGTQSFQVASIFIQVNLAFFVFNMIPFPPLDGSRLLYAFAPEPLQKVMYRIERAGIMAIVLFILILFPVISPVISHTIQSLYSFILG